MNNLANLFQKASVLLIGLVISGASIAIAQDDAVSFKWKSGDKFSLILQQQTVILTDVDNRTRQVDNLTELEFDQKVTDVDDEGVATIEQSFTRIRIKTGPPGVSSDKTIDFDTVEPDKRLTGLSKSLRKQVLPLIGMKFTCQFSPRGEILNVTYDEEMAELLREVPASTQVRQMFTPEGMNDLLGTSWILLPEKKLSAGDQWTTNQSLDRGGSKPMEKTSTYTYNGTSADLAEFTLEMELASEESTPPEGIKLNSFSGSGDFTFNEAAGFLSTGNVTSVLESEANYRDKLIRTTVTTTTSMKADKR